MSLSLRGAGPPNDGGLPPGALYWFEADQIAGNDGDAIGTWADHTGNGHDLTQATAGLKPVLKTNIVNGLPVVRFDGSDDFLKVSFTLAQPVTIFAVAIWRAAFASPNKALIDAAAGAFQQYLVRTSSTVVGLSAATATLNLTTTPQSWHVYEGIFNGASSSIRADEGSPTTGNPGSPSPGGLTVGTNASGSEPGNVDVAAIVGYASSLSTADRQAAARYLGGKYGIAVA